MAGDFATKCLEHERLIYLGDASNGVIHSVHPALVSVPSVTSADAGNHCGIGGM